MKWFAGIRAIALLRRIARALEESNELQRIRTLQEFPDARSHIRAKRGKVRQTEIIHPTPQDWNEAWAKQNGR